MWLFTQIFQSEWYWWAVVAVSVAAVVKLWFLSWWKLQPGNSPPTFQREYSIALVSGIYFVLMGAPAALFNWEETDWRKLFGSIYVWMPIWAMFNISPYWGGYIRISWIAFYADLVFFFVIELMFAMNRNLSQSLSHSYVSIVDAVVGGLFVYCVARSKLPLHAQQYIMWIFSYFVVDMVNPNTPADPTFSTLLVWQPDAKVNLFSEALLNMFAVLGAMVVGALAFVPLPECFGIAIPRTAIGIGAKDLSTVAEDICDSLRSHLTHFEAGDSASDGNTLGRIVQRIRLQWKGANDLLATAQWEALVFASSEQLQYCLRFSELLDHLHVTLLAMHAHVCACADTTAAAGIRQIMPRLEEFQVDLSQAMGILAAAVLTPTGLGSQQLIVCVAAMERAEASLSAAIQDLLLLDAGDKPRTMALCLVELLRTWSSLVQQFLGASSEAKKPSPTTLSRRLWAWSPHHAWMWKKQAGFGCSRTIGWLLALAWTVGMCGYSQGFLVSTSMLHWGASGLRASTLERHVHRMLGITSGLALGNAPAEILFRGFSNEEVAHSLKQRLIIYFVLMYVFWVVFFTLAQNSYYAYAAFLCCGFGGAEMVSGLIVENANLAGVDLSFLGFFSSITVIFQSAVLVMFVEWFIGEVGGDGARARSGAADSIEKCLSDLASTLEAFPPGGITDVLRLRDLEEEAWGWAAELQHEVVHKGVWKADLAKGVLEQFHEAWLAIPVAMQKGAHQQSSVVRPLGGLASGGVHVSVGSVRNINVFQKGAEDAEDVAKQVALGDLIRRIRECAYIARQLLLRRYQHSEDTKELDAFADRILRPRVQMPSSEQDVWQELSMTKPPGIGDDAGVIAAKTAQKISILSMRVSVQRLEALLRKQAAGCSEHAPALKMTVREQRLQLSAARPLLVQCDGDCSDSVSEDDSEASG